MTAIAERLLGREVLARIPPLYGTEPDPDPIVHAKLFTPWAGWTWYLTECDGTDRCFGLVDGLALEIGYFSLQEIASVRGPGGLEIERDLYFEPKALSAVRAEIEARRTTEQRSTGLFRGQAKQR